LIRHLSLIFTNLRDKYTYNLYQLTVSGNCFLVFFRNHAEITKRMIEKIQEQTEIVEVLCSFSIALDSNFYLSVYISFCRSKRSFWNARMDAKNRPNTIIRRSTIWRQRFRINKMNWIMCWMCTPGWIKRKERHIWYFLKQYSACHS